MLRMKINPQTVISVQNSIPKIITTLILITFSYAIAGLLIDSMYLFQAITIKLLFSTGVSGKLFNSGIVNPTFQQTMQGDQTFLLAFKALPVVSMVILAAIPPLLFIIISAAATGGAGAAGAAVVGGIGFAVILLVLLILFLWQLIKLFFGLVKCYVIVIIRIIFGPLEIAMGAIPNMKMGFSTWMINIIANLAVFPIVVIFLIVINIIIEATAYQNIWVPNQISGVDILTMAGLSGGIIPAAIGLVGVMMVAKLPTLVPEMIFQIKPTLFGKALGESLKPVSGAANLAKTGAFEAGANKGRAMAEAGTTRHPNGTVTRTPKANFVNSAVNVAETMGWVKKTH